MLTIRGCDACEARIRTVARALARPGRCPYCKAELAGGAGASARLAPNGGEWAVWVLGWSIHAVGVALPVAVVLGHRWFSMNWLGAGIVAAILAVMLHVVGRATRVGAERESVGINIVAMILSLILVVYGFVAFTPLDGLGGASMVLLALVTIVLSGPMEASGMMRERAEKGRIGGWFILLSFLVAYGYHAAKPWLGR